MIEFLTSPGLEIVLRILGALAVLAIGVFGWFYFRQAGGQAASTRLNSLQKDIISALESRIRLLQTTIEDLERILKRTKEELESALGRVKELIRDREKIG